MILIPWFNGRISGGSDHHSSLGLLGFRVGAGAKQQSSQRIYELGSTWKMSEGARFYISKERHPRQKLPAIELKYFDRSGHAS